MVYAQAKSLGEVQDYTIDWSNELASGETISSDSWTVPSGITKDSNTNTDSTTTIWLSGGTGGEEYALKNKITTNAGRDYEKTIIVPVTQD
jgi:hypothetical protein